jgi:copper oxidase (laccase) domain-containing protein
VICRPSSVVEAQLPVERFAALSALSNCRHFFTRRIPGVVVSGNKAETLQRLHAAHAEIRRAAGVEEWPLVTAEQVHGNRIAVIDRAIRSDQHFAGCDGLISNQPQVALGIHVADCCAVFVVDPKIEAIGLIHSGKRGTELAIVGEAIKQMQEQFGSKPADLVVQLSPCIRPPHYETDFAAKIVAQCGDAGVRQVHGSGVCTACQLDQYYSYRAEKGKTGRMLALLGLN